MCITDTLCCTAEWHNIVNQIYFNKKKVAFHWQNKWFNWHDIRNELSLVKVKEFNECGPAKTSENILILKRTR